jgi:23S rRNA (guanosine2251-2'-O)-methyltransferase
MHLAGRRPVLERLTRRPETIRSLYLSQGADLPEIVQAARQARISPVGLASAAFQRKTGEIHAQGVLAEVDPFRYAEVEDLIQGPGTKPLLLLLDRITDPQNLGSILRTTACLGGIALVLPKHDSAGVTDTVLRVACGGENHVPVALVTNLSNACQLLKRHDYWIAGAQAEGGTPLHQVDWPSPLAVILGSEGGGIRHGLQKQLDLKVTLPMPGAALSFNVAVAAALIAYEIRRPRR